MSLSIAVARLEPALPVVAEAHRTPVTIGRRSVQFVEVVAGLAEGDRVSLSDLSSYDACDRLRLD